MAKNKRIIIADSLRAGDDNKADKTEDLEKESVNLAVTDTGLEETQQEPKELVESQDSEILTADNAPTDDSEIKNSLIKVRKLDDTEAVSINRFDMFFIKLWAFIVAMIGTFSKAINWCVYKIFKKRLPDRYVRAFISAVLIILLIVIVSLPFSIRVESGMKVDVYGSYGYVPVKTSIGVDTDGAPIYKWGYINKEGKTVIEPQFEEALPFKHNVAWVRVVETSKVDGLVDDYWMLINKKGKPKGSEPAKIYVTSALQGARPVEQFPDDTKWALVYIGGLYGYINANGKLGELKYLYAESYSEGLARVRIGNEFEYYINTKGETVGDNFEEVMSFSDGMGAVRYRNNWGFINSKGKMVIQTEYTQVSKFIGGYAAVRRGNSVGIIDKKGKYVIAPGEYYDVYVASPEFRELLEMIKPN